MHFSLPKPTPAGSFYDHCRGERERALDGTKEELINGTYARIKKQGLSHDCKKGERYSFWLKDPVLNFLSSGNAVDFFCPMHMLIEDQRHAGNVTGTHTQEEEKKPSKAA